MNSGLKVHAFVMAGGNGTRLHPLTDTRCKPALPFGGGHRVVDFVLANLRNSGFDGADVLVQYRPEDLVEHVRQRWSAAEPAHRLAATIAWPPERPPGRLGRAGYAGTADAVFQNLARCTEAGADLVAVLGADHVYRFDLRQMIDRHFVTGADVSIAALPVPLADAGSFGIVETDADGRCVAFHEKPQQATPMPGRPSHALASMGNYLFNADTLRVALAECCTAGEFDFGHHVLPRLLGRCHVQAYDFHTNRIPGIGPGEEAGYWRDVGTVDAYFHAHMDTLGPKPRFALDNPAWPLTPRGGMQLPALVVRGETLRSRLGGGALVERASLQDVVVGANARVLPSARLERCVLFDGVSIGPGACLRNVIVDEDNQIPAGERIGFDVEQDRARFPVSEGGIVVVPRGHFAAERALPPTPQVRHAG